MSILKKEIVIIGGGTAGLTAAIYCQRAGKQALVLESEFYGGQIINTPEIENYPAIENISGFEFAMNLKTQAEKLNAEFSNEKVIKIEDGVPKKVFTAENTYECDGIIIATGASNRPLGLENEKDFVGKGISYCATCDGMFYKNKTVAVVGGGNTALEDAFYLSNICEKVYLVHRRNEFRGEQTLVNRLKEKENVVFVLDSVVEKLNGENSIESIDVLNKISNEKTTLSTDGVFVAIGQIPNTAEFKNTVATDDFGYIKADENCETNIDGVFVAGDCRTKNVRQLATAAADGAVAATKVCEYLNCKI